MPKITSEAQRTKLLRVRLKATELKSIQDAAAAEGRTIAELVRSVLLQHIDNVSQRWGAP